MYQLNYWISQQFPEFKLILEPYFGSANDTFSYSMRLLYSIFYVEYNIPNNDDVTIFSDSVLCLKSMCIKNKTINRTPSLL